MLTPEVEEKGILAAFNGRTMESIRDVEFSRNVSIIEFLWVIETNGHRNGRLTFSRDEVSINHTGKQLSAPCVE